jgi:tetratricopeptide (TPR) repeat protein/transcriptional regulator with XRE-family HTH domain
LKGRKVAGKVPNERLKHERERRCWSQAEVAARIKTDAFTVSRWESGITFPSITFRRRLCKLFDKSAEELGLLPIESQCDEERSTINRESTTPASLAQSPTSFVDKRMLYDPAIPSPLPKTIGLIGRYDIVDSLRRQLHANSSVALHGLPGSGKTALVVEIAHDSRILETFQDGILWAGLGREVNPTSLLDHWGRLLQIAPSVSATSTTTQAWTTAIHEAIGLRRMLIIIDDAWDIQDALTFKLGGANCAYLLTTRFPGIASQFADDNESIVTVHELSEEDSVTLLARLAPQITTAESEAALELARSVGGLPLALTLIGKYLRAQSYSGQPRRLHMAIERLQRADERLLLAQPQAPLDRSSNLPPDAPRSLRAVIEISEQRLDKEHRAVLHALSIFPPKPNTFSEEAAIAVGMAQAEMLDLLTDSGLLEGSGPERYTLHQTIADYTRLQPIEEATSERFVSFFVSLVETRQNEYEYLELELQNILAALSIAHTLAAPGATISAIMRCAAFLEDKRLFSTAKRHLNHALALTRSQEDKSNVAAILLHQGRLAELRGDLVQAELSYEEGLSVARQFDLRATICALLAHLGEVAISLGNYMKADDYLQEGLLIAYELDDQQKMLLLLKNLGEITESRGAYALAGELYRQGLELARQLQNWEIASALLQNLGAKTIREGDETQGEQHLQEGLSYARRIGHQQRISGILLNLGNLAMMRQQYTRAEDFYQETLRIARKIEHKLRAGSVLQNLGELETLRGNYAQAARYLEEGLEIAQQIGHPWLIYETRCVLAELHLKQGQVEIARTLFQEVFDKAQELGARELVATALFGLARVAHASADDGAARQLAQESSTLFLAMGHRKESIIVKWMAELPQ